MNPDEWAVRLQEAARKVVGDDPPPIPVDAHPVIRALGELIHRDTQAA